MTSAIVNMSLGKVQSNFFEELLCRPTDYSKDVLSKNGVLKAPGEGLFLTDVQYDIKHFL